MLVVFVHWDVKILEKDGPWGLGRHCCSGDNGRTELGGWSSDDLGPVTNYGSDHLDWDRSAEGVQDARIHSRPTSTDRKKAHIESLLVGPSLVKVTGF